MSTDNTVNEPVPASKPEIYKGPESRKTNRRETKDRREQIRFEVTTGNRRHSPGRRSSDANPWFHGTL